MNKMIEWNSCNDEVMNACMDGWFGEWVYGWMVRWIDGGWMIELIYGLVNGYKECRIQ